MILILMSDVCHCLKNDDCQSEARSSDGDDGSDASSGIVRRRYRCPRCQQPPDVAASASKYSVHTSGCCVVARDQQQQQQQQQVASQFKAENHDSDDVTYEVKLVSPDTDDVVPSVDDVHVSLLHGDVTCVYVCVVVPHATCTCVLYTQNMF